MGRLCNEPACAGARHFAHHQRYRHAGAARDDPESRRSAGAGGGRGPAQRLHRGGGRLGARRHTARPWRIRGWPGGNLAGLVARGPPPRCADTRGPVDPAAGACGAAGAAQPHHRGGAAAEAVAAMKATLGSFAAYLPRDLIRQFLASGIEPHLGGERLALSLMFTDVQGFTTIGEALDPMELTQIASAYFEEVTHELLAAGATIDKYIGDSVMAFWNAPRRDPSHAAHACAAALRTRAVTVRLAKEFVARGWPALPTRFGVHTGEAVVGNVGSSDRMTYTAMGGMVNLANRLEGLNKLYGTQILVSETTRAAAGRRFVFRPVDIVIVKGTESPMPIHELLGFADRDAPPDLRAPNADIASLATWEDCVAAYREGRFDAARTALGAMRCASKFPVAAIYAARLAELGSGAAPGWSPAERMTVK